MSYYYILRNRLRKAGRAYERIFKAKDGPIFEISWVYGKEDPFKYDTPSRHASLEFAVIMSDFILPDRFLNLEDIYNMLGELSTSEDAANYITQAQSKLTVIEQAPPTVTSLEGIQMNTRDVFIYICKNLLFNDDIPASEFVEKLNSSQHAEEVWKQFHNYCMSVYNALVEIDSFIHEKDLYPRPKRQLKCIYCKSTTAEFSVEHSAPESLGNEASILPYGYVCTSCNNIFSKIEDDFLNGPPLDLPRFLAVNASKKGRTPSIQAEKIHLEKTSPNSIKFRGYAGKSSKINVTKLSDGMFNLKMPELTSKNKFNHILYARVLFKMAIAAITIEEGREIALQPRYNPARDFALNGGTFSNWLFLNKKANIHKGASLQLKRVDPVGTAVLADILGVHFGVGLEPLDSSAPVPDANKLPDYLIFDLRRTDAGPHICAP